MSIKLKRLTIKNFKCFAKEKTIDLSKLTILTGANSSGKSSILHAILGTIQSGEFPFKFSPNGKFVDMGDFKEISNRHLSNDISISLTFKAQDLKTDITFKTIWTHDKTNSLPELKQLIFEGENTELILKRYRSGYLFSFNYDIESNPDYDPLEAEEVRQRMKLDLTSKFRANDMTKKQHAKFIFEQKKYINATFRNIYIDKLEVGKLEDAISSIYEINNPTINYTIEVLLDRFLKNYDSVINVISSFRNHPSRTYLEQSKDKLKVDKFGEGYLDQILLWEKTHSPKFKELQDVMRDDLGLINSLKGDRKMGGGRYEVLVKTKEGGLETSLFDVGFGVNQFMPIIVADLQLPEGSTLFIAEPEIHLHPNVQALFGDYLVKQINKNKKNYVIETHSEYLLNRIRLAIVKGTLKETDLSVYFLENSGVDTEIHKLKFEKNGEVKNAPKEFFDTYMMDVMDIALNS